VSLTPRAFVQGNKILDNKVEVQTVTPGRVIGIYAAWASFNHIENNDFDSLTYDAYFATFGNHNTVLENHFFGALVDSIYLAPGSFGNNITTNEIDSPGGNGINHQLGTHASGAHVITYNSILTPGWCGIRTPDLVAMEFVGDILYGNFGNMCVY